MPNGERGELIHVPSEVKPKKERGELVKSEEKAELVHPSIEAESKSELSKVERFRIWLSQTRDMLMEMKDDPAVREGAEPALRTAINTAIAIVDVFPGIGGVASWGADAAKIWARVEYNRKRKEVEEAGGDPDTVELSPIDLTPDVSVEIAVITEFLEPFTAGTLPSHAIEGSIQLYHDWPKLRDAAKRIREIYQIHSNPDILTIQAAEVFNVKLLETKE